MSGQTGLTQSRTVMTPATLYSASEKHKRPQLQLQLQPKCRGIPTHQSTNDHYNNNYTTAPTTTTRCQGFLLVMERSGGSTQNNFSTMPRTLHAPINQQPPQLQLNSSDQPTMTTATATRCGGPDMHQSTNDHRSFN
jgi:hypothetical protein